VLGAALDVENTVTPDGVTVIPVEIENASKVIVVTPTLEQVFPAVPFSLVQDSRVTVCVVLDNAGRVAWEKTAGTIRSKQANSSRKPELLFWEVLLVLALVVGGEIDGELYGVTFVGVIVIPVGITWKVVVVRPTEEQDFATPVPP
jgi:hypothetical protein